MSCCDKCCPLLKCFNNYCECHQRQGDWIQTYTGKKFYIIDPRPEDVDIIDIAHSLSLLNRFNGHTKKPYSVAQHSVLIADKLPDEYKIHGLLHDAHEAYTGDFISPLKRCDQELREIINLIQSEIQQCICEGLLNQSWKDSSLIHEADMRMLMTEKRDLFTQKHEWRENENYQPYPDVINPWDHNAAEKAFLIMYSRLTKCA